MPTQLTGIADLPFSVIVVTGDLAVNVQVDFYAVAKLPIDLKAQGVIGAGLHQYNEDLGAISQLSVPAPSKDLPSGITEVHRS